MSDIDKKEDVSVSEENALLQKSLEDLQKTLEIANARAEAAEKEKEEIAKAAEEERVAKAKEDLTEVVKSWDIPQETSEVVKSLFEAGEGSEILIKAMNSLNDKVEEVKKSFGEDEKGLDGELEKTDDVNKAARAGVSKAIKEILKAKNSKKKR